MIFWAARLKEVMTNLSSTVKTPSAMELRIIFISVEVRSFSDFM